MRSDHSGVREKLKGVPYEEEIARFCENVIRALNPLTIILYGSLARGDYRRGSDVDIIVIAEDLPPRFADRVEVLLRLSAGGLIEPRGYTPEEFLEMVREAHGTALDAVKYGMVLYDRGFMERARRAFEETVRELGLRRVADGWKCEKILEKFKRRGHPRSGGRDH